MIYIDGCNLLVFLPDPDASDAAITALQKHPPLARRPTSHGQSSLPQKVLVWYPFLSLMCHCWLPHNQTSTPHKIYIHDAAGQPTPILVSSLKTKKQNLYFYVLSHVLLLKYHRLACHHFVSLCGLEPIVFGYY